MLSDRLKMVAQLVNSCNTIADIGTDHGYIPIWLIKNNVCKYAIATDVSKGSCDKAQNNVNINRLNEFIDVRCGNGLEVIDVGKDNVDTIIISGMGGLLMIDVLNSKIDVVNKAKQLVLQPQRDINKVREFIINNGFKIENETIIKDKDKIYIAINAIKGTDKNYSEKDLYFGKFLPYENSHVFKEYVNIEMNKLNNAIINIKANLNDENIERYNDILKLYNLYKEV